MNKRKRQAVITATIHNLKRDRDFWKRRAEVNIKQIEDSLISILRDKDRKLTKLNELKRILLCERSELDKIITINIRLSDLFEAIEEIKDEASMWRKAYEIDNRIKKIEEHLSKRKK